MITNAMQIVEEAKLLTYEDFALLDTIKEELMRTWSTVQIFRTRTEMEVSVLNDMKHPTPDAKYWQSVREQNVMFQELVNLSFEYRKNAVEIKILEKKRDSEHDELEKELFQIEIEKKNFDALTMSRIAHDRIREIKEWHSIMTTLIPHMKFGVNEVNNHQRESFLIRFKKQAGVVNNNTPPADAINLLGLNETAKRVLGGK